MGKETREKGELSGKGDQTESRVEVGKETREKGEWRWGGDQRERRV